MSLPSLHLQFQEKLQAPTLDTEGKANDNDEAPFPQNERGLHKLELVHIAKTGYVFVISSFFDSLVKYIPTDFYLDFLSRYPIALAIAKRYLDKMSRYGAHLLPTASRASCISSLI